MEALTRSEEQQVESIRELKSNPLFEVTDEKESLSFPISDFDPLSGTKEEWADVRLSAELKDCALRFWSLSCQWHCVDPELELHGEFCLPHLYRALLRDAPRYNDLASEPERSLMSELRLIDFAPARATGEAAYIRIEPHKDQLEIWYQDRYLYEEDTNTQGFLRMELDYCAYLEALRLTKGAFGWQMLFVDVELRGLEFRRHRENLTAMLRTFPSAFPQYDYAPLISRLEARL
ncbi:hypothetical protein GCM10022403_012270 [Streptomyces coacervatus]|uniref:Uncharacterized protein n=1 Tax=Streptomyces coacervatus TaxID=647381 RepID=A0ABP7H3T3_9ACTN